MVIIGCKLSQPSIYCGKVQGYNKCLFCGHVMTQRLYFIRVLPTLPNDAGIGSNSSPPATPNRIRKMDGWERACSL